MTALDRLLAECDGPCLDSECAVDEPCPMCRRAMKLTRIVMVLRGKLGSISSVEECDCPGCGSCEGRCAIRVADRALAEAEKIAGEDA